MKTIVSDVQRRAVWLIPLALLSACAVGPDFKRPAAPVAAGYTPQPLPAQTAEAKVEQGKAQTFMPSRDIPQDWWTLFRSAQLNSLVERAFKANPDIGAAQAALAQAQQNVIAQQGFFYPTVGISYTPSRNKLAGNNGGNSPGIQSNGTLIQTYANPAGPKYNGPAYYNFHVAQLTVGYVPDVFGLQRRTVESAEAQLEIQQMQLQATYITLASNVVAAAFQEASLRGQIAAMENVITLNRENLDIMRKQQALGYVAEIDVAAQQATLAQAEQALPPLRKQLELTRDLIRALAGNTPDQDVSETFTLADLHLPEELPLSLPSRLVEQRPDVRAAEAQLHAASAQYGVAIANRLPQFSVLASMGGMASAPNWMFRAGGGFFSVVGNVAQTLFDGGSLRAQSKVAEQALNQSAAQYHGAVIAALQNVADTLHCIASDAEVLKAAATAEQASHRVLELTQKQYQAGYVSYQNLLLAEQNYQLAAIGLIQAQAARLGDSAALYQALGGGWWNRPDAPATLPKQSEKSASGVQAS
ncbi:MAG: efflux transporter outer membrane subunit [Gallionella sp.]|nr:efflux transporter outer membrane subunit [Gallionella sp.]MDD4947416.1 efflux transporter outer membrane subunit [Gallionella sp.]